MLKKVEQLPENIAWNGISFKIPLAWEIDSLDACHMLIGEDGQPRVEFKWTEAPRKFTLEKYLKKFISQSQRMLDIKIHELSWPKSFSHPVKNFEFFFFSWESLSSSGYGTLIFCTQCKRLTMIRFFADSKILSDSLPGLILTSFTDHPVTDHAHWQMFGMNFSVPWSFKLVDYSFKPGCYIVNFKHDRTTLKIFSWGPALFLLSKTNLEKFAAARLPGLKGFTQKGDCLRGNYLEWSYRQGRFKNADALPFLKRHSLFRIFRICHDEKANRIFGVQVDSPKEYGHDLIKRSMIGEI
ncbi:MAG: hypothetical protein GXP56_00750 [Deltaproteobacteria bacterium]|nr:hypothetical protein [Deltaproteobacteria bacterium]